MRLLYKYYGIIVVLLLSLIAVFPLLHSGLYSMHDDTQVARVIVMARSLSSGMFPVRWVEGLGFGYGYPIFNFYGPLPYYIGAGFYLLGFGALVSTKVMVALGVIASGITMYILTRRYFGEIAGIVCGIIYLLFPYHAVNIYVRGAVGELYAYAFLPLFILGILMLQTVTSKKIKDLFPGLTIVSISVFLIATSHNLSLLMLLLVSPVFILVLIPFTKKKVFFIISALGAVIFGLALSSFYIIPAFSEMKFTDVASQVGNGSSYLSHFVCIPQFWDSLWGFGGSAKGCMDGLSFRLGKLNIILVLVTFFVFLWAIYKKKEGNLQIVASSFVALLVCLLMAISVSEPLWKLVPYIAYLQFPWRFINFIALFSTIIIGYLVYLVSKASLRGSILLALIIIITTIITNHKLFQAQFYNSYDNSYYESQKYLSFDASRLTSEYMPKGFVKPKVYNDVPKNKIEIVSGVGSLNIKESSPRKLLVSYVAAEPIIANVNLAYFPTWSFGLNSKGVHGNFTNEGVLLNLEKGSGVISFIYSETSTEIVADLISVTAFLALIVGIIYIRVQRHGKT